MKELFHRGLGFAVDQLLCGSLGLLHQRHAGRVSTLAAAEEYVAACEKQTRADHFAIPTVMEDFGQDSADSIGWRSPARYNSVFPANSCVQVKLFRVQPAAPTVIMLHALMSASDIGYGRWAGRFNALGWNAAFVHLPFHYSRRPGGYLNGELCCTSDLILTGDTLRQAVVEIRQLLGWLRTQGSREFGLLATSYGGWVGAIVASLEADFRFIALLAPMVNTVHALYEGPTSWAIRGQLMRAGLEPTLIDRHAHLSSPFHAPPAGDTANRTLIVGGAYDHIVRVSDLMALREAWKGSEFVTLPQGHFGYGMIPRAFVWLRERDLLSPS